MVWSPQPLLLKAAAVLAAADTEGQYSLFNHSSLGHGVPWSYASTGSAMGTGSVLDSSFVALLPWLGLLGFNMGHVVDHMMKLGSVTWEGVGAKVRRCGVELQVEVTVVRTTTSYVVVATAGGSSESESCQCTSLLCYVYVQEFRKLLRSVALPTRTSCPAELGPLSRFISCGGVSARALIKALLKGDETITPKGVVLTLQLQVLTYFSIVFMIMEMH